MEATTLGLLRERVAGELRKHLPVAPGWFSKTALETGELAKFLEAVTAQVVEWLDAIKATKSGIHLDDAQGDFLVQWGRDLHLEQRDGESDADFRQRIKSEILRLRLTRAGVQTFVADLTGFATTVELPWRKLDWRGQRNIVLAQGAKDPVNGRSGRRRRSSGYYQGGVIDIVIEGFNKDLQKLADQVVAAGVKAYFTSHLMPDILDDFTDLPPGPNSYLHFANGTQELPRRNRRSGLSPRSGFIHVLGHSTTTESNPLDPGYQLYDQPERGPSYDLWNSAYTWADLADLTWDQAMASMGTDHRQPSGVLTIGHLALTLESGGFLLTEDGNHLVAD